MHHVEQSIESFVNRELISLLNKCASWTETPIRCSGVEAASNSFSIELECEACGNSPVKLRVQEQSGWILACTSQQGWLHSIAVEQRNSFFNALEGFYRKCGIDLVREQLETNMAYDFPYDISPAGLVVWPTEKFDVEIVADL